MKKNFLIMMTMVFAMMISSSITKAQFSDSCTVDNSDPRFTKVTFAGMLNGTGTLSGKTFKLIGDYTGIYSLSYYLDASDDSVNVTIALKGGDYAGKLVTLKTLASAQTSESGQLEVNMLPSIYLDNNQFYISGGSGNGDSTYFYGTAKFYKKENKE